MPASLPNSLPPAYALNRKSKFLSKNAQIPITWAEEYRDFKEGYRGGAVDVYRPHGYNLYYYDVNSALCH